MIIGEPVPDPKTVRWDVSDLCPAHLGIWRKWRVVTYNPRNPREWPGGAHIMDSRTPHDEREQDWRRRTTEQMQLTAELCRSGSSPQCDHPAKT